MNVLIVDDEKNICVFLARLLTLKGFSVTTASDGPGAIDLAANESFDIIFMDVRMPEMNGIDAFRVIRKQRPQQKVVMMTGYAVDELIQTALDEGAIACLRKPFDFDEIMQIILDNSSSPN